MMIMNIKRAAELTREYVAGAVALQSDDGAGEDHAAYMLDGILKGYIQHEKAHRWLGYAQALLVSNGVATLDEMKAVNKEADDETP